MISFIKFWDGLIKLNVGFCKFYIGLIIKFSFMLKMVLVKRNIDIIEDEFIDLFELIFVICD